MESVQLLDHYNCLRLGSSVFKMGLVLLLSRLKEVQNKKRTVEGHPGQPSPFFVNSCDAHHSHSPVPTLDADGSHMEMTSRDKK